MIQEIITYAILLVTIIITMLKFYRFFAIKAPTACSNCFQAESGCKVAHLKKQIQTK